MENKLLSELDYSEYTAECSYDDCFSATFVMESNEKNFELFGIKEFPENFENEMEIEYWKSLDETRESIFVSVDHINDFSQNIRNDVSLTDATYQSVLHAMNEVFAKNNDGMTMASAMNRIRLNDISLNGLDITIDICSDEAVMPTEDGFDVHIHYMNMEARNIILQECGASPELIIDLNDTQSIGYVDVYADFDSNGSIKEMVLVATTENDSFETEIPTELMSEEFQNAVIRGIEFETGKDIAELSAEMSKKAKEDMELD
ncbi:MAG: hypothetical protein K2K02_04545 [Ruminococcus sp.]|nr:hypothetical protein [Ruminococcus sp.]